MHLNNPTASTNCNVQQIGIIGAGQLAAYLCQAASSLGHKTTVFASQADDIAINFADRAIIGAPDDLRHYETMIEDCDVITFDKEDIPTDGLQTLETLAKDTHTLVAPNTTIMKRLQNKATQKEWLVDHGFPTADFLRQDTGLQPDQVYKKFGANYVIKSQRGGYDGKGVQIVDKNTRPSHFLNVPCIAEALVPFHQEIAVLVARSRHGSDIAYPPVSSSFDTGGNVLRQTVYPSLISANLERRASDLASSIVKALDGVGIFAIEMFVADNEVMVNEISPRVHNSGHLTLEACTVSQFEQHIRAITGIPLKQPTFTHPAAVMQNLLHEPNTNQDLAALTHTCKNSFSTAALSHNVFLHNYGKKEPRPLRKMGHITALGNSIDASSRNLRNALARLQQGVDTQERSDYV